MGWRQGYEEVFVLGSDMGRASCKGKVVGGVAGDRLGLVGRTS